MKSFSRLLQLVILVAFFIVILNMTILQKNPEDVELTKKPLKNIVDLESDQSFSCAAGFTIQYNVYIKNEGGSTANYTLTALSNQGYYVEVWRDTNQVGDGDIQLIPPQGSMITLNADEVATLIVRVTVPSDLTDGTVDNTVIKAESTNLETSDFVTVTTTVDSNLPYPSNWIQLGSDSLFPAQVHPIRMDIKALYYANNGTHVFFRMAEGAAPDTTAFRYTMYLDTKTGGQQIDSFSYDYLLSSDGNLHEWNGEDWVDSGYTTYLGVDGTGIVLWTNLDYLNLDMQDIHILACTTTKDGTIKDMMEPYSILRDNISEIPLILIPIVTLAVYFAFARGRKKDAHLGDRVWFLGF